MRCFDPNIAEHLVDIFSYVAGLANREIGVEFLKIVVIYISTTAKAITAEQVNNALNAAFKDDGGAIMGGFVEELIEQGKQVGQQQGLRNAILDLLRVRFDAAPLSIINRLEKVIDVEVLILLNRQAGTAESLADFEQYLNSLKK
jgi:hypothetical protein